MNVAIRSASAESQGQPGRTVRSGRCIARVEILRDLSSAESIWRGLERDDAVKTPYQSFDLLASWQGHVGAPLGVAPFIVVGFDSNGRPAFLWPMGSERRGPLNVVSFLGGKHANFNFALWRRDIAASTTAEDIRAVLDQIAGAYQADVFSLLRQPLSWEGIVNPFSLLQHQSSPSESLRATLGACPGKEPVDQVLSSSMRGRLRSKERRLQTLPGYRYLRATTASEVDRLLDAFFPLKAARMAAQALPNIFGEPRHEAFLREVCHHGIAAGKPMVEIHALEDDRELIALFGAVNDGRRSSGMFNTYTLSDNAKQSPGLLLLVHVINDLAGRGVRSFDLGVGEANYKTVFCKEPEPLFDSFLPLTPLGRLAAIAASAGGHLKRQIKQSRVLWSLVQTLRQSFASRQD